jgi:hypothetical protein
MAGGEGLLRHRADQLLFAVGMQPEQLIFETSQANLPAAITRALCAFESLLHWHSVLNNALLALTDFLHIPNVLAQMRLYKAVVVRFLVCPGIVPHLMVLFTIIKMNIVHLIAFCFLEQRIYPLVDDLQYIAQSQLRAFCLTFQLSTSTIDMVSKRMRLQKTPNKRGG